MTYSILICDCASCQKRIVVNPDCCPSIRVENGKPDPNGKREPICRDCFNQWNEIHRTAKGLKPIPLSPNAYEPLIIE